MFFENREDAGSQLSQLLKKYKNMPVVVYALPRGGVPVAAEIARFLEAPIDLIFAHKIGHPYQPEYAIAAISESGHMIGPSLEISESIGNDWLEMQKTDQLNEIKRKREKYLNGRKNISVENKIAILVDDGIATGLTMIVGINELKDRHPKKIVVAVPVAPRRTSNLIKTMVDDFVGIEVDDYDFLGAVGAYYKEFNQVEDDEVIEILNSEYKRNLDK
ncbi:phosphoribosyltransferase [Criblamydia sequanensis]|uniref:Phosphoribosyltransferase n=1 Tax=Candidatus Criblamydia sequanensis CRIB-18 TaxID=1437425 RepID=A0A090D0J9_9BACT|nr:phosphoribosyltransferase family protein [Criblamydia sequanensis]CDR34826.1 Putative phosphoribosyltransferase [Criblamydia sequanensis CRIB-18]